MRSPNTQLSRALISQATTMNSLCSSNSKRKFIENPFVRVSSSIIFCLFVAGCLFVCMVSVCIWVSQSACVSVFFFSLVFSSLYLVKGGVLLLIGVAVCVCVYFDILIYASNILHQQNNNKRTEYHHSSHEMSTAFQFFARPHFRTTEMHLEMEYSMHHILFQLFIWFRFGDCSSFLETRAPRFVCYRSILKIFCLSI